MICLTGNEKSTRDLERRLNGVGGCWPGQLRKSPLMQEIRLDCLEKIDDELWNLLSRPNLILTCRSTAEGGSFRGTEAERLSVLRRALKLQPDYLDVELAADQQVRQEFWQTRGSTKMIVSYHQFATDQVPASILAGLKAAEADVLKIAVLVEDAAQLALLRPLLLDEFRPVIRLGMGEAGLLSRARYTDFGSPWTYVSASIESATAPGQLTIARAQRWRVPEHASLTGLGVLGGEQVLNSPGPRIYNRLFLQRDLPYQYLPIVSRRPVEAMRLVEQLGFAGLSVTMPAKEQLALLLDDLQPPADRLGAVNTICFENGRRIGYNTDALAVRQLLEPHRGKTALLLGAGGAARAAAFVLHELACPLQICARHLSQAQALATPLGAQALSWDERALADFEVLVNATPLGSDGQSSPLPEQKNWSARVALDMVAYPPVTPLIEQVQRQGGQAIAGLEMWRRQGAAQMTLLTKEKFSAMDLIEAEDD